MTEKQLLKTESKMSRTEAAEKMHDIADKIKEGKVELASGSDSVRLQPADNVEFEIEVEKEDNGETSIELEIEWYESDEKQIEIG